MNIIIFLTTCAALILSACTQSPTPPKGVAEPIIPEIPDIQMPSLETLQRFDEAKKKEAAYQAKVASGTISQFTPEEKERWDNESKQGFVASVRTGDPRRIKFLFRPEMQALRGKPADPNLVDPTTGDPLLTIAVKEGHAEMVRTLVEIGADPKRRGRDGKTPLAVAREMKRDDLVKLLAR